MARLSGNKFAFLLEGIQDEATVLDVAKQIQAFLTLPFNLNRMEVFITVSIGIVVNTSSYDRSDHLLRDAGTAMHQATAPHKTCCYIRSANTIALTQQQTRFNIARDLKNDRLLRALTGLNRKALNALYLGL